jgi:hypothetical protein
MCPRESKRFCYELECLEMSAQKKLMQGKVPGGGWIYGHILLRCWLLYPVNAGDSALLASSLPIKRLSKSLFSLEFIYKNFSFAFYCNKASTPQAPTHTHGKKKKKSYCHLLVLVCPYNTEKGWARHHSKSTSSQRPGPVMQLDCTRKYSAGSHHSKRPPRGNTKTVPES